METIKPDVLWVCREIQDDMARDACEFDGKPFNGRTVAEYLGNQGAAIAALAGIVADQEARLRKVEAVAHAPVELAPAIRDIVKEELAVKA